MFYLSVPLSLKRVIGSNISLNVKLESISLDFKSKNRIDYFSILVEIKKDLGSFEEPEIHVFYNKEYYVDFYTYMQQYRSL